MADGKDYNYLFKIVLIGNSGVGKSSILYRFSEDKWEEKFVPTIGVDFVSDFNNFIYQNLKAMEIDGKKIKLQIWDTAGQEKFRNINTSYYKGANGILVVYDITNRESFDGLNSWLIEIEKNSSKDVYKLLIGNKNDMEEKRQITFNEGKDFASINGMEFFETSAKTADKIQDAFELLAKDIMRTVSKNKTAPKKDPIKLEPGTNLNLEKKKLC